MVILCDKSLFPSGTAEGTFGMLQIRQQQHQHPGRHPGPQCPAPRRNIQEVLCHQKVSPTSERLQYLQRREFCWKKVLFLTPWASRAVTGLSRDFLLLCLPKIQVGPSAGRCRWRERHHDPEALRRISQTLVIHPAWGGRRLPPQSEDYHTPGVGYRQAVSLRPMFSVLRTNAKLSPPLLVQGGRRGELLALLNVVAKLLYS